MNKLLFFLWMALFMPSIKLSEGLPTLRPELLIILYSLPKYGLKLGSDNVYLRLILHFSIVAFISIISSYTVHSIPFNSKDLMIYPMLAQYALVLNFGFVISKEVQVYKFFLKLSYLFLGVALIGIAQTLNLFSVNDWLTPIYNDSETALDALKLNLDNGRSPGTVGDPRHFALLLNIGLSLGLVMYFSNKYSSKLFFLTYLIVLIAAIAMTASRTGFLVAIILVFIIQYHKSQNISSFLSTGFKFLLFSLLAFLILFSFLPEGQKNRLFDTDSDSFQVSTSARQRDNLEVFQRANTNPLILLTGLGPAKSVLPGSEHSDFGWFFIRYGFFGFLLYVLIFQAGFKNSKKLMQLPQKSDYLAQNYFLGLFGLLTLTSWFIFAFAESIFKLNQLMSVFLVVLGLVSYRVKNHLRGSYKNPTA